MIRGWESKLGAELWLDDNPETEGAPYLLRAIRDYNGQTSREVWAIRTQDGYVTVEEWNQEQGEKKKKAAAGSNS